MEKSVDIGISYVMSSVSSSSRKRRQAAETSTEQVLNEGVNKSTFCGHVRKTPTPPSSGFADISEKGGWGMYGSGNRGTRNFFNGFFHI